MFFTIVTLLALGMLLLFLELFVFGGVIGILGGILMMSGVVLCFREYGVEQGFLSLIGCGAVSAGILWIGFKVMPNTALGRRFFLAESLQKDDGYSSEDEGLVNLLDREGVTDSDLRPAGIASIDGQRVNVMSDGEFISAGSRVKVSVVNSNRVIVTQI